MQQIAVSCSRQGEHGKNRYHSVSACFKCFACFQFFPPILSLAQTMITTIRLYKSEITFKLTSTCKHCTINCTELQATGTTKYFMVLVYLISVTKLTFQLNFHQLPDTLFRNNFHVLTFISINR